MAELASAQPSRQRVDQLVDELLGTSEPFDEQLIGGGPWQVGGRVGRCLQSGARRRCMGLHKAMLGWILQLQHPPPALRQPPRHGVALAGTGGVQPGAAAVEGMDVPRPAGGRRRQPGLTGASWGPSAGNAARVCRLPSQPRHLAPCARRKPLHAEPGRRRP